MIDVSATIVNPTLANWEKELIVSTEFSRIVNEANEELVKVQAERDRLAARCDKLAGDLAGLKASLQASLFEWANANLDDPSDDSYRDLHEIMSDNGLEGLKRTYDVNVRVTFEFVVEVEATNEDAAYEDVDVNLTDLIAEHVGTRMDPNDYDISPTEA